MPGRYNRHGEEKKNVQNYELWYQGEKVYDGISNDIWARFDEHEAKGKVFDEVRWDERKRTFSQARRSEINKLTFYRERNDGRQPKYNKKRNG